MNPYAMNPYAGVLLLDPKQVAEIPAKITVEDPGMEVPIWVIGDGKDMPDWVQCFPDLDAFYKYLEDNESIPLPEIGGLSDDLSADTKERLAGKLQPIADKLCEINEARLEKQDTISKEWLAKEKDWKWPTDRKPRVLAYTLQFSSVMKHQAACLLKGFEKMGCETRLVTEQGPLERVNVITTGGHYCLPLIREINEFEPDMFVDINFYRVPMVHGTKRPHYTWIQDRTQNLNEDLAAAVRPNDFLGMVSSALMSKWLECGFPQSQMSLHPCNYDGDMFYPPEKGTERKGIVYIEQNGAVTPFDAYKRLRNNYPPEAHYIIDEFYGRCANIFAMGDDLFEIDYVNILKRTQKDLAVIANARGMDFIPLSHILRVHDGIFLFMFSHDVGNRFIRQRPLVEIARAGLPLELYGHGWEKHPILAPWAKGPVADYSDIPDIYRRAQIVLQLQHECTFIHRTVEGLACGAHMMIKGLATDHEYAGNHVKAVFYNRPGEAALCAAQLLQREPPSVEETGVLKYKSEVWAEKVLDIIGERMVQ